VLAAESGLMTCPHQSHRRNRHRAAGGMCARWRDMMACINTQGTLAVLPWTPMMAGTLTT
jgi:hypothetical protein